MCKIQGKNNLCRVEFELGSQIIDPMDSSTVIPVDESQRVKFLCSFSGTILPRPQDGKLRYVGGETRIVSVPRDIAFDELMGKMKELFDGAAVLKYQQPDEDLDALVSVVNDDDVTNMMEEYDKLGTEDGFTRLRLFLFVHADQDGSLQFGDGDERDNERRYVDALNSLNELPDFRKPSGESMMMGAFDDVHVAEQYFNQMNLSHLNIPHLDSVHLQQAVGQRYSEMEAPWSPAYYSPRQPGSVDQRHIFEFPSSPSSSRYRMPYGEFSEKSNDRIPEDYNRPPTNTHPLFEQQPPYPDNLVMLPGGHVVNEKAGFPGNIFQGPNIFEGNSVCGNCRMTFPRNSIHPDPSWKPGDLPHLDPPNMGNGYLQVPNSGVECTPNREGYMLSADAGLQPPHHSRDQNNPRLVHSEPHGHERGWVSPHQPSPWAEENRPHLSMSGRLADGFIVENGLSIPLTHGNACDGHHVQSHYMHHDDQRYACTGVDYSSQAFPDQTIAPGSQVHLPSVDDRGIRYGNPNYNYQVPHGHISSSALWRNGQSPLPGYPTYEASVSSPLVNGSAPMGYARGSVESSPGVRTGLENHSSWAEPSQKNVGFDGTQLPDYSQVSIKIVPNILESRHPRPVESIPSAAPLVMSSSSQDPLPKSLTTSLVDIVALDGGCRINAGSARAFASGANKGSKENIKGGEVPGSHVCSATGKNSDAIPTPALLKSNVPEAAVDSRGSLKMCEAIPNVHEEQPGAKLELLPELIVPVTKALHNLQEVKGKPPEETVLGSEVKEAANEDIQNDRDEEEANVDVELDNDNEVNHSKIEMTKAEAEAIDRGLQTIKNEDLEEIRELGSGTYGAVYYGKWKGSDVAIKRIKASCFAGRPSERERLIADFWKEALILSSLHHPNVVSFYGVVRDGPDGSLATVTEFMVNGSLKQFLQKKDRTIDRRKRLLIAMDTAFGMEYLHGKNIVHFDLKCENLLVNMRDPHRPICKIGDLGLSKVKQNTLVSGGVRGTLPWMAPELLSGKSNMVTEKIDVYSFGIVMWELLTGDEPYSDMHCASIIGGIVNNSLRPQIPSWCDPEWKSLMESCWAADPAQRPSFTEISQKLRNMAAAMNLK